MAKATSNNINLNISDKQKFTINGDESKYIMLNPADMGIVARLGDAIPILNNLATQYEELMIADDSDKDITDVMKEYSTKFKNIDSEARRAVNILFDYDVSSVCASGGSMMDVWDGEYRFSVIITTLMDMYENTISKEMDKMVKKMKSHTDKYTPQDRKPKKK